MILGEDWICAECGNRIRLFVKVSEPPVCANPQKHSSRPQEMQRETEIVVKTQE